METKACVCKAEAARRYARDGDLGALLAATGPDRYERDNPQLTREPPPTPIDPRPAREARRREIDAILREDARVAPAFARARMRAVMAALEGRPLYRLASLTDADREQFHRAVEGLRGGRILPLPCAFVDEGTLVRDILAELHYYEEHRGGETRPRPGHGRPMPPAVAEAVEVYERSRGLV